LVVGQFEVSGFVDGTALVLDVLGAVTAGVAREVVTTNDEVTSARPAANGERSISDGF